MEGDVDKDLKRILKAWERIRDHLLGMDEEDFLTSPDTQAKVLAELVAVGDAVKRVPGDVRMQAPYLEWDDLEDMPDQFGGGPTTSDLKLAWARATNEMYELRELVTGMPDEEAGEGTGA